jgi:DNA-binding transcriptional LysR family regulator
LVSDFTLRQLELFCALEHHSTLSAAATALHISESALSSALSELERSIGAQLCVRRRARGIQLTPTGKHFANRARGILLAAGELAHELAGMDGTLHGPVTLGCHTSLAPHLLPTILEAFATDHPGVLIDVAVGTHDDLFGALRSGSLDLALVYNIDLPEDFSLTQLYETEVMAVLPADHRLSDRPAVDLADLVNEPLIMLDTTPSARNTLRTIAARGLKPRLGAAMPQIELVRALVSRGLGYSLLMSRPNTTDQTIDGRKVVTLPLEPRDGVTHVMAIWPEQIQLTARVKALVEYSAGAFQISAPST